MGSFFCNLEPFFVGGRPQQNQNFSCGWPIWGYFCYRAYWNRPLFCVCYLGCVCIYHPDTRCYISVPFDFKTEEVQCFVCVLFFFSVHEVWFHCLRVLVYLKFSVVSFWNFRDFALVRLDYTAWHFRFFWW